MRTLAGPVPEMKGSPCVGNRGGERRVNPSVSLWGTVPWGGRRAWGCRLGCLHLGPGFCATTVARNELPVPLCLSFPNCEDRQTVACTPCWKVGFGEDPGESAAVKTAEVRPRPGPSALGWPDFSLVLLGLDTVQGSVAERPHSAGRGKGPLRPGAPCAPQGQAAPPLPPPASARYGRQSGSYPQPPAHPAAPAMGASPRSWAGAGGGSPGCPSWWQH